jgi:hemoglobin-like flavoprotein
MSDLALPEITRPDAHSARMVQRSIAHLAGRELQLTEGFYRHLFAMLPEARALFPEDMAEQRGRLLQALLSSVQSLHDPAGMEARLQALGEIHYYRGIADDQYQYVGHALIRTVRDVVPADWSTWLSSAWISVYSWMIQHMVVGAKRARTHAESGSAEASFEAAQRRYAVVQARTGALSLQAIAVAASVAADPPVAYPGRGYSRHAQPAQDYQNQGYGVQYGAAYGQAVAYPAQDHPAQGYAMPSPEQYREQYQEQYREQYREQYQEQYQEHSGEQYPARVHAGPAAAGASGDRYPYASDWVRFPPLAEVGEQPVAGPGAVVPPAQAVPLMSPPVNGLAVPVADRREQAVAPVPEFSFVATPAAGTELSWFGDSPDQGQVSTVFPRRRRGSGLV